MEKVRDGRSYSTRRVDAMQESNLLFMATMSFQVPEPEQPQYFASPPKIVSEGAFELARDMPDDHKNAPTEVLPPELSRPGSQRYQHALTHSVDSSHYQKLIAQWTNEQENFLPVEFRPAVPNMFQKDGSVQFGSKLAYWLRARGASPGPANRQRAILGFHVDQFILANIRASVKESSVAMMASLDHTMWFYNDFTMGQWLLMVVRGNAVTLGGKPSHE